MSKWIARGWSGTITFLQNEDETYTRTHVTEHGTTVDTVTKAKANELRLWYLSENFTITTA